MSGTQHRFVSTPLASVALAALLAVASAAPFPARAADGPALAPRTTSSKSLSASLDAGRDRSTLIVKLADGSAAKVEGERVSAAPTRRSRAAVAALVDALALAPGARIEPAIRLPAPLLDAMRHTGERNTGRRLADLTQFFVVRLADPADAEPVLASLLARDAVENAYALRRGLGPVDIPPTTPDFVTAVGPGQGYRNPAPEGIDVGAAIAQGLTGAGVTVADVETNWNLGHEDLDHLLSQSPPVPLIPEADWLDPALPASTNLDHGTATLGVLASGDNAYGTTGLVPGATIRVVPILRQSDPSWIAPDAVLLATLTLAPGDVILLEVEKPAGPTTNLPFEIDDLEFAVVEQATALGIHVIEPAGNSTGGLDLDNSTLVLDPATGKSKLDVTFRDSGAVMVGGGDSATLPPGIPPGPVGFHNRYVNSNFGTRVGTYAWGNDVTTLGYGPSSSSLANCANPVDPFPLFPPDPDQQYTFCYNGTSSAGAIVAGAAVLLEEKHRATFGQPASPRELRNLMELGTPAFGAIGHQPDLLYQLDFIDVGGVIPHYFEAEPRISSFASVANFGDSVAGGGDVDGDGVGDLVVGVPDYTVDLGGGSISVFTGRVYVYSGADGSTLYTLDGAAQQDRFGTAVATGDLDGDGLADLVVGAAGEATAGSFAGMAQAYSGADGTLLYSLFGQAAFERFGAAVAVVGDVDGDGGEDFLVGAPDATVGRAELYSGRTGTLLTTFTSPELFDRYAFALAAAGDVDGDGVLDVAIGAPDGTDPNGETIGRVYVHTWTGGAPILTLSLTSGVDGFSFAEFGSAVAAGDVTGDGVPEILVGAPGWTFTPGVAGLGKVFLYSPTGVQIDSFEGTFAGPSRRVGEAVAMVGDFDGDGNVDVAAAAPSGLAGLTGTGPPGRVVVHLGPFPQSPAGGERIFATKDTATLFGKAIAAVGDVNGDGNSDLLAGEPFGQSEGRAFVFSAAPGPSPLVGLAKLVANPPVIEARDTDGDGFGGGGLSPSSTTFEIDAGPAWGGDTYVVVGFPDPGTFLTSALGTLDAAGTTSAPLLGPVPASILCPVVGLELDFIAAALKDVDGDGTFDAFVLTNWVEVEVINEFGFC